MTAINPDFIEITRLFSAPRERVFKAWTDPDQIKNWACPHGFIPLFGEMDLRVGGVFRSGMRSPEGEEHIVHGVYKEIAPPARLVFSHAWEDQTRKDGSTSPETLVTVTFVEEGGKTRMTFRQEGFTIAESRDGHQDGWSQSFEKLESQLQANRGAKNTRKSS